ncbi:hypothetical protein MASR1M31_21650 [Porphyromonadaceae bacterium]
METSLPIIVKLSIPWKASIPMLVTLLGIVTLREVRLLQSENAVEPILATLLGIDIAVKFLL